MSNRPFNVKRSQTFDNLRTVAEVQYPDESRQILVYDIPYPNQIPLLDSLDPHFSDTGALSPLARFEPTERGGKKLAGVLQIKDLN